MQQLPLNHFENNQSISKKNTCMSTIINHLNVVAEKVQIYNKNPRISSHLKHVDDKQENKL